MITDRLGYGLVVLVVAIILIGFSKNFYLRAWLGTRPLTLLAYAHGFMMTAWVILFVLQLTLVASQRTATHRKIGRWGGVAALLLVIIGVLTISAAAARNHAAENARMFAITFVAYDGLSLLLFGTLVCCGIAERRHSDRHKRLMLMALVALLPPAFGRLIAYAFTEQVEVSVLFAMLATLTVCVLSDARRDRNHNLHPHAATWLPAIAIALVNVTTYVAQVSA